MGQAAIDLPDPMQDKTGVHAGGADDLLAQLAGDEIDRLLAESDVEKPGFPVASAPVQTAPSIVAGPAAAPVHLEIPIEAEIAELHSSATHASSAPPLSPHEHISAAFQGSVTRIPLWLKPLQWLNAPLDAGPVSLRDTTGKIAILTLVNAIALLAYIAMFRRHHG